MFRPCGAGGASRVAELEAQNKALAAHLAARDAQLEAAQAWLAALAEQVEELRPPGKDSSTSSKPPSPDNPHRKKPGTGRCSVGEIHPWLPALYGPETPAVTHRVTTGAGKIPERYRSRRSLGGDALCGREAVKRIQAGELVRAGLDGDSGPIQ